MLTLGKSRVDARKEAMEVIRESFTWIPPFSDIVVTDVVNTTLNITLNITALDGATTQTRVNGTLSSITGDASTKIPTSLGMRLIHNPFVGNLVYGAINTALVIWNFVRRKRRRSGPPENIVKSTKSNTIENTRIHSRAWDATPHIRAGRTLR
jgi:hypothetical protein